MTTKLYRRQDFINNVESRWCPGCGDYAVLAALQRILPKLGIAPENHVFVSGIGCAGRLPYYMNAYGFHTIHGRATAVATGLKAMREDLSVWVITGDGDALSIGTNHLIHTLRRNVNLNILLLNNQVYGLTKGQFSPTSKKGQITKTSPLGVYSEPLNPLMIALASGASFVARAVDKDPNHLGDIIAAAHAHPGCSFIEIYQDCNVFNSGTFDAFSLKNNRSAQTVLLQEQQLLSFGNNQEWALDLNNRQTFDKVPCEQSSYRHNPSSLIAAMQLAQLSFPEFPVPLGIYYKQQKPVFSCRNKVNKTTEDLLTLFKSKASWEETPS